MRPGKVPDVATLAEATVELLQQGIELSAEMRRRLALRYGLDPSDSCWPRFVNNHAWALVELQARRLIYKVATGHYRLVAAPAPPGRTPDVATLMEATVALMRQGLQNSDAMRLQLAPEYAIAPSDSAWPRFVNNHAWALVRLQAQGVIRKVGPGIYQPVPVSPPPPDVDVPPILDGEPLPDWAKRVVSNASAKNKTRWQGQLFEQDDIRVLWEACDGRCTLTGLPFKETQFGTGQARKPFAPSLDRVNPAKPYTLENCRLVLQAVNFALNVWGDEVFLKIAEAAITKRGRADNR